MGMAKSELSEEDWVRIGYESGWLRMASRGSCWKGYTQKGMKRKGDKWVPNCIKSAGTNIDKSTEDKI